MELWSGRRRFVGMTIYRLFQNGSFEPEHINLMTTTFDIVCHELGLSRRDDALRDLVAKAIIVCAETGVRDPDRLRDCARDALRK